MARRSETAKMAQSLLSGDIEWALYECGSLLYLKNVEAFEDALIEAVATAGESVMPAQGTAGLWQSCAESVLELVSSAAYPVKHAFAVIAKVCLLCKRIAAGGTRGRAQLPRLRDKILTEFPEGPAGSADLVKYRAILPAHPCPERDFSIRILSGLSRQLFERRITDFRDSLEYLSRKKNNLALPTLDGWPAPSRAEADKGDFIWFLWATRLLDQPLLAPFLELFRANYTNKKRDRRLGLLWGTAALANPEPPGAFDAADLAIIKRVEETSGSLWAQLKKEMPALAPASATKQRLQDMRGLEIMEKWEPRDVASTSGGAARSFTMAGQSRGIDLNRSKK